MKKDALTVSNYRPIDTGVANYGAHAPLDFKLFNFSGHFRTVQTLNIRLHVVAYPAKIYWHIALSCLFDE